MKDFAAFHRSARNILAREPSPIVRYRLLRDVLGLPQEDAEVHAARQGLEASLPVMELADAQYPDGGWGRFHSMDSSKKMRFPTTEYALARGLALGLDAHHPVFERAISYLEGLLSGQTEFPDPSEGNDRWSTGTQLFAAAALALIAPQHPALAAPLALWEAVAARAFASRRYDPSAEQLAHAELIGATVKNSYLELDNRYTVALLSVRPENVPPAYLDWLWGHDLGLGYFEQPLHSPPGIRSPRRLDCWFSSIELFSRFPAWRGYAAKMVEWLWSMQGEDGLWDFGPRWPGSPYFPLSENWRKSINRKFDHSTRVLALLARYYAPRGFE